METEIEKSDKNVNDAMEIATSRQVAKVQGAVLMAKKFPRNAMDAMFRIQQSCKRKKLAEAAEYSYPKGGKMVRGASIRLAEVVAQNWGNMSCGIAELSQSNGESIVMAYAWDQETNFKVEKVFTVKHEIKLRTGQVKKLDDEREIYEMVANKGARRMRACILAVIPADVFEEALEVCHATLTGSSETPLKERLVKMLDKFIGLGVDKEMIEKRLGHKIEVTIETEFLELISIYNSIKDEMSKREKWFDVPGVTATFEKDDKAEEKAPADQPEKKERVVVDEASVTPKDVAAAEGDAIDQLPDTSNMPDLVKLMDDAQLFPRQLNAWAKKNGWDLSDSDRIAKMINGFEKIKIEIAKF